MLSPRRLARNARLLLQSGIQHLVDDPALLVVQVSRRLPFAARVRAGTALRAIASHIPGGNGAAALGAFMAGDHPGAQQLIERSAGSRSRMRGEVALTNAAQVPGTTMRCGASWPTSRVATWRLNPAARDLGHHEAGVRGYRGSRRARRWLVPRLCLL